MEREREKSGEEKKPEVGKDDGYRKREGGSVREGRLGICLNTPKYKGNQANNELYLNVSF